MVTTGQLGWIHRGLRMLQGLLMLATAGVIVVAVTAERPEIVQAEDRSDHAAEPQVHDALKPLAWFAPLWQRDWRQSPIPPSVEPPEERPTPPPELPHLLGTFLEAGQSFAHFRRHDGRTQLCSLNALIDDYEVTAIETNRVHLRRNDETYWVEVPKRKAQDWSTNR